MKNYVEAGFLGWILEDSEKIHETIIKNGMLEEPQNKEVLRICEKLKKIGEQVNIPNVVEHWVTGDKREAMDYMFSITEIHSSGSDFKGFEDNILKAFKDKRSREYAERFGKGESDLETVLKKLQEIKEYGIRQEFDKKEELVAVYNKFEQVAAKTKKGIKTGFKTFDNMTGGLQDTDYYIFGARPSVGKTAFMLNIARGVNNNNENIFHNIFSLEQLTEQIIIRLMNQLEEIDSMKWLTGDFQPDDFNKVLKAMGELSTYWDFGIYDKSKMTVAEIRSTVKDNMRKYPDHKHIIYIDYLGKIGTTTKHNNENSRVTEISGDLKALQRDLKIPLICLSQLSRENNKRQDKRPMMSDIRDSGSIEQDADVIGLLHREDYYDRETDKPNILEVDIQKARNGITGVTEFYFKKEYGRFENLT